MTILGLTAPLCLSLLPTLHLQRKDVQYESVVEIVRVQATPVAGSPRRWQLDITFNLAPDAPKGLKVFFGLYCQGLEAGCKPGEGGTWYTLQSDNRKNLKLVWAPSERLTVDKHMLQTQAPLGDQTPEVQKAIEANPKRFPPGVSPWAYFHVKQEFTIGTPADEAAEMAEVKGYFKKTGAKLLELFKGARKELEKAQASLDKEGLKKFLAQWGENMGKVQADLADFPVREPGLYLKHPRFHRESTDLGRMIAKWVTRTELANVLKKHNLAPATLRAQPQPGLDPNFGYPVRATLIEAKGQSLLELVEGGGEVAEGTPAGEGAAAPAGEEPKEAKDEKAEKDGGEEKDATKSEEGEEGASETEKAKEEKKSTKKGTKKPSTKKKKKSTSGA